GDLGRWVSRSFGGLVPLGTFAVAVIMTTPVLFLPFLLTLTGRFTSCRAPHCGPVSRPGVLRVNVAGCDLNWRLCSWLGGAQPENLGLLMEACTFQAQTVLQGPSLSQGGAPAA